MSEPTFGLEVLGVLADYEVPDSVTFCPRGEEVRWHFSSPGVKLDGETATAVCKAEPGLCVQDEDGDHFRFNGSEFEWSEGEGWIPWSWPDLDSDFYLLVDPEAPEKVPAERFPEAQRLATLYLQGDRFDPKTGRHVLAMAADILRGVAECES